MKNHTEEALDDIIVLCCASLDHKYAVTPTRGKAEVNQGDHHLRVSSHLPQFAVCTPYSSLRTLTSAPRSKNGAAIGIWGRSLLERERAGGENR